MKLFGIQSCRKSTPDHISRPLLDIFNGGMIELISEFGYRSHHNLRRS